jgi:hypothetical protein
MKRKPPKALPTHADSTGDIKVDLTQEQLAAFGAAALAYNVLEDQIDALLFIVTRIPDWLFSEVSSRIHGLDGKVAIIQEAVSHSGLEANDAKAVTAAVALFGEFKTIRDTMIHARLINVSIGIGRGAKHRGKSPWEVLLSTPALNTFYDHIIALEKELSSAGSLLNSAITLKQIDANDPNRSRYEEALQAHTAQFRESHNRRQSLRSLPKFPDEEELRLAANRLREARVAEQMSWFQHLSQPVQHRGWLWPGVMETPLPLKEQEPEK